MDARQIVLHEDKHENYLILRRELCERLQRLGPFDDQQQLTVQREHDVVDVCLAAVADRLALEMEG